MTELTQMNTHGAPTAGMGPNPREMLQYLLSTLDWTCLDITITSMCHKRPCSLSSITEKKLAGHEMWADFDGAMNAVQQRACSQAGCMHCAQRSQNGLWDGHETIFSRRTCPFLTRKTLKLLQQPPRKYRSWCGTSRDMSGTTTHALLH